MWVRGNVLSRVVMLWSLEQPDIAYATNMGIRMNKQFPYRKIAVGRPSQSRKSLGSF